MTGSAVSEPAPLASFSFAARRTAQQQRHLAIGDGLLGQIVIDDHGVHAVVAEVLTHGAAGEGREELHRGGVRGGRGDDDGVFHRATLFEHFDELGDGRTLLADGDIHAVELLALRRAFDVQRLLVQDGVERDRGLAGLAVTDDQLALATADGDEGVDGLEAGRHRLMHRLARNDAGGLHVHTGALGGLDRTLAVDRIAERVDDAAQQLLADRHVHDRAGALHGLAFLDVAVRAEDHDADVVGFEVQGHATHAVLELDHFAGLDLVETEDARNAVTDRENLTHFGHFSRSAEILDLLLEDRGDLSGADIHRLSLSVTSGMRARLMQD
jgi:hypothetical protein